MDEWRARAVIVSFDAGHTLVDFQKLLLFRDYQFPELKTYILL